jgi:hypothetical protein
MVFRPTFRMETRPALRSKIKSGSRYWLQAANLSDSQLAVFESIGERWGLGVGEHRSSACVCAFQRVAEEHDRQFLLSPFVVVAICRSLFSDN